MFCDECGQLIAFTTDGEDRLIHKTAETYPFLDDHEPVLSEPDAVRFRRDLEEASE